MKKVNIKNNNEKGYPSGGRMKVLFFDDSKDCSSKFLGKKMLRVNTSHLLMASMTKNGFVSPRSEASFAC